MLALSLSAMLDDVVGLVMVQIIGNLGQSASSLDFVVVLRPLGVSLGFAILVPVSCRYVIHPLYTSLHKSTRVKRLESNLAYLEARFLLHSLILFGFTAAAGYSGTSVLFTAYLCGVVISWWDQLPMPSTSVDHQPNRFEADGHSQEVVHTENGTSDQTVQARTKSEPLSEHLSGLSTYHAYLMQPVKRILRPFFFVSNAYIL